MIDGIDYDDDITSDVHHNDASITMYMVNRVTDIYLMADFCTR